jgi:hypothetical protein
MAIGNVNMKMEIIVNTNVDVIASVVCEHSIVATGPVNLLRWQLFVFLIMFYK